MFEKKLKAIKDMKKEFSIFCSSIIKEENFEGFFVIQKYGYTILNKYDELVHGICVEEIKSKRT